MILLQESYVYVVLEYHLGPRHDEYVHGVYSNRETANAVKSKILSRTPIGYVCVLKQKVKGPGVQKI